MPILSVTLKTLASSYNVRKIVQIKLLLPVSVSCSFRLYSCSLPSHFEVTIPPPFILMGSTQTLVGYLQYKILKLHVVLWAGSRWTFFCICCVQTWLCTLFLGRESLSSLLVDSCFCEAARKHLWQAEKLTKDWQTPLAENFPFHCNYALFTLL